MATLSEIDAEQRPAFNVQRSDLTVHANFRTHLWSLFHDVPSFYAAVLRALADFGVTPHAIRSEVGDGSLGAYNVNFWMLDFRTLVRVRLERLEIQFNNILQPDVERLERAFVRLIEALQASNPDFAVSGYLVDIGLHGDLPGVDARGYLARFVTMHPTLPGPYVGSGAVFYHGEDGPATFRSLTADLSRQVTGGLYVGYHAFYNGTVRPEILRTTVEADITTALRGLGLTRTES